MKLLFLSTLLGATVLPFFVWAPAIPVVSLGEDREDEGTEGAPVSLLFVGDIMLGRGVETHIEEFGLDYPYVEMGNLLSLPDVTIGNFEAVVAETHVQTPNMTFQFSVKEEYMKKLMEAGFDVLSLANNHSLDYGEDALEFTRLLCDKLSLVCGGTPLGISEHTRRVLAVGEEQVGILFLHTVWKDIDETELKEAVRLLTAESTFQIAYVHWGNEYELVHSVEEEQLAEALIDEGIDVVVGHHPHVIQDIGFYKGKPIFYSLGNFIFDQYFSYDVQEGLAVHITLTPETADYRLLPHESRTIRIQPRPLATSSAAILFRRIFAGRGEGVINVEGGAFSIPRK